MFSTCSVSDLASVMRLTVTHETKTVWQGNNFTQLFELRIVCHALDDSLHYSITAKKVTFNRFQWGLLYFALLPR